MQTDATHATLPLFTATQLPPPPAPPRPKRSDPAVLDAAVELLWPSVLAWLSREEPYPEDEHDDAKADLRKHIGYRDDGYDFAKGLDGWDPDSELVEILDGADMHMCRAHEAAVEAWVAAHHVQTPLPVGTRVRFKRDGKVCAGETYVNEHNAEMLAKTARYAVFCEALGHVREGEGTLGVLLDAEDVEQIG